MKKKNNNKERSLLPILLGALRVEKIVVLYVCYLLFDVSGKSFIKRILLCFSKICLFEEIKFLLLCPFLHLSTPLHKHLHSYHVSPFGVRAITLITF